jgi:hypothetical protein
MVKVCTYGLDPSPLIDETAVSARSTAAVTARRVRGPHGWQASLCSKPLVQGMMLVRVAAEQGMLRSRGVVHTFGCRAAAAAAR